MGLEAPKDISFVVDSLYNPISMTQRLFTSIVAVKGADGKNYNIEEGSVAFSARTPTTISNVNVTSTDTTV